MWWFKNRPCADVLSLHRHMCQQANAFIFSKIGFRDIHSMITVWMLSGISGGHLVQAPHIKHSHTELFVWDHVKACFSGDSTAFLGNPCQCWDTLTVMKCFLKFRLQLLCLGLCPLPLLCHCASMESAWLTRLLFCKADF